METERKFTLDEITTAMGAVIKDVDPTMEFVRLWRIFIGATTDKLKALPGATSNTSVKVVYTDNSDAETRIVSLND